MPDLKISQLTSAATPLAGTEVLPVVQSGSTVKVAVSDLTAGRAVSASALTASSGNLTFSGTAQRITGDFSNATPSNWLTFQTSTANGNTSVGLIPNGTGVSSGVNVFNSSDPNNSALLALAINAGEARLVSNRTGTGTYLPMTFYTGGNEAMRIDTSRNVGIGTASPGGPLSIQRGDASTTIGGSSSVIKVNNSNGTLSTTAGIEFFATADLTVNTGRMAGIYGVYSSFNASGVGGALVFATNTPGDATIDERMRITAAGNIVAGASAALATTATDGFLYVPTCAGTPTGTPTAITGMAPIVVDTTNNKLYFYSGGTWRDAGP